MEFLEGIDLSDEDGSQEKSVKTERTGSVMKKKTPKETVRKGGYRPVLVDEKSLEKEAVDLSEGMDLLNHQYSSKQLSDQDTASLYILLYLNYRYPNKFLGSSNPVYDFSKQEPPASRDFRDLLQITNSKINEKLKGLNVTSFFRIINDFNLHCVPHSARVTMVEWYMNKYNLVLMVNKIPSSKQVLQMQSEYKRCVSLISNKISCLVMGERDPLSFLLHDLVHAYKMFSDQQLLRGQVGFCRAMLRIYANQNGAAKLDELLSKDEEFADAFDYLISDMNSHPKHLFFYFKAVLMNVFKKRYNEKILEGEHLKEFQDLFELFINLFQMNEPAKEVARRLFMYSADGFSVIEQGCSLDEVRAKQKQEASIFDDFFLDLAS